MAAVAGGVGGGGGGGSTENVTQTAHGFLVKDAVAHNGTTWVKAQASASGVAAQGIVTAVADANTFTVQSSGKATLTAHGLTSANYYWLSQATAGAITATQPTSGIAQSLLYVRDANTVDIAIEQATVYSAPALPFVQRFTSNGTYTPTQGMKYCIVEGVGGGGAGGGNLSNTSGNGQGAGGGGGGAYFKVLCTAAQIGASRGVTIGGGGVGVSGSPGQGGGTTSVTGIASANGGNGGVNSSAASVGGRPGTAGNPFTIALGIDLGSSHSTEGIPGFCNNVGFSIAGGGGNSRLGAGAPGDGTNSVNQAGGGGSANPNTGGGGGGRCTTGGTGASGGGSGGSGLVLITEYFA